MGLFWALRFSGLQSISCPVWYPYLSRNDIDKLESFQSMCTRIILPLINDYNGWLSQLKIEELSVHLNDLCLKYVSKVQFDDDHVCRSYLSCRRNLAGHHSMINFFLRNLFNSIPSNFCTQPYLFRCIIIKSIIYRCSLKNDTPYLCFVCVSLHFWNIIPSDWVSTAVLVEGLL